MIGVLRELKLIMLQLKEQKTILKILVGIIPFFLWNCGLLIKQPKYSDKPFVQRTLNNQNFCYQDSTFNYIDNRINNEGAYIVLAIHGLGAHAGSFTFLQNYLEEKGVSSLAMDLRGFGHWQGKKGDVKNIGIQVEDLHEIIQNVRIKRPNKKIILLGESLGTSLALWYANLYPENIDGLVLTSLVTSSGSGEVEIGTVLNLLSAYVFNPTHPVKLNYNPKMYSNDIEFLEWAFNKDSLGTRSISPRYLVQANRVIKKSYKYLCTKNIPVLLIQGGKDNLSTKEKVGKIVNKCGAASLISYKYYPDMFHSIVNDKNREKAFEGILGWLETQ